MLAFTHSYEYSPANTVNCPVAHIHILPVELLQHIFLLVVNDIPDCPGVFSYGDTTISANVASPPLVFTRVCRFWRVVAHLTTAVWSRMQVSLPGRVEPLTPFLPSFLQSWLARSGNQPLTLRIASGELPVPNTRCCTRQPGHEPSQADSQLLTILLSESKRWGTVTLVSACDWNCDFDTPQLKSYISLIAGLSQRDSDICPPVTTYVISGSRVPLPASYAPLSSCSLAWSPLRWM